jgi:hypothetical protein
MYLRNKVVVSYQAHEPLINAHVRVPCNPSYRLNIRVML